MHLPQPSKGSKAVLQKFYGRGRGGDGRGWDGKGREGKTLHPNLGVTNLVCWEWKRYSEIFSFLPTVNCGASKFLKFHPASHPFPSVPFNWSTPLKKMIQIYHLHHTDFKTYTLMHVFSFDGKIRNWILIKKVLNFFYFKSDLNCSIYVKEFKTQ